MLRQTEDRVSIGDPVIFKCAAFQSQITFFELSRQTLGARAFAQEDMQLWK